MAGSAPQIPITLNPAAYAKSSLLNQVLAMDAHSHITTGRFDLAVQCLRELLEDRCFETNPLILDAYTMHARIACDRGKLADACAYLQLAADPSALAFDGPHKEYRSKYNAVMGLIIYLQSILKKPRVLDAPARHYETETNFDLCHFDTLRGWALGKGLPMPAEADWLGVEALRGALKQRFPPPMIYYLAIVPHKAPFLITPEAAPEYFHVNYVRMGMLEMRTQMLYNDDLLERAMGNVRGWPEGHFFRLYEVTMYDQPSARRAGLERNYQAKGLLHYAGDLYGPVLVQMSCLLKHRETRLSLVGARQPLSLEFLGSLDWKNMRMEFRAFNLTRSIVISPAQIALQGESTQFHMHLA